MAFLPNDPSDLTDDEKKKQQEAAGGSAPSEISGAGGTAATGAPVEGPGTGFTNLRTYLDANKGQGADLANKIGGSLKGAADTFGEDVKKAETGFEGEVGAGGVAPDDDLVSRAGANPVEFTKNQADVDKLTKMRDATYKGPNSFEDRPEFGDLSSRLSTLENRKGMVDTESGRLSLLKEIDPTMGAGKLNFNNLLLSGDPGARDILGQAVSPYSGLRALLENSASTADKAAATAKAGTESAKTAVHSTLDPLVSGLEGDLKTKAQTAEQKRLTTNKAIQDFKDYVEGRSADRSGLSPNEEALFFGEQGQPTPTEMGITDRQRQLFSENPQGNADWLTRLFRLPPGQNTGELLTKDQPIEAQPGNLASADDYARMAALEKMLGYTSPVLNTMDPSQAGTYFDPTIGTYGFDIGSGPPSSQPPLPVAPPPDMEPPSQIAMPSQPPSPPFIPPPVGQPFLPPDEEKQKSVMGRRTPMGVFG